ncbi:hypothetical protein GCM10007931_21460 [Vibrio algivorus]|uniref:Secreted protein n=1 Tax=Vibrio algivorus TaxID=1667024 RepID=A0ABQ6EQ97_9VIBR|nr:hypothetical protein GCM10007931_21460 [Vibrio algivorus]
MSCALARTVFIAVSTSVCKITPSFTIATTWLRGWGADSVAEAVNRLIIPSNAGIHVFIIFDIQ